MVWLRRSLEAFNTLPARHIVAIPARDLKVFRKALGHSNLLELICQEDLVDPGFYPDVLYRLTERFAPQHLWRLAGHAGKPGWIVQQIVKLSSNRLISDGPIIFLDSDIFFYRHFSLEHDLGLGANQRVLVRIVPEEIGARHPHHVEHSRQLFGLPAGASDMTYMGYPAIWYPDWLSRMQQHIESISGKPWQQALLTVNFNISEYTLYGIYLEEILRPPGLSIRSKPYNLIAWDRPSFEALKLRILKGHSLPPECFTLCLQSNVQIPVVEYQDMLATLLTKRTQAAA